MSEKAIVARFCDVYRRLNKNNITAIREIYDPRIRFVDPFHTVVGLPELETYFARLYQNVESISFEFAEPVVGERRAAVDWVLTMKHRQFKHQVVVPGATMLEFGNLIRLHRDYFDAGAMVYENVPLLGSVIRKIKKKL